MTQLDTDVLVIGAGPVGLAFALELGLRGIRVLVAERGQRGGNAPRAKTTTVRTRTHLRRWGLANRFVEASPLGVDYPNVIFTTGLASHHLARIPNAFNAASERSPFLSRACGDTSQFSPNLAGARRPCSYIPRHPAAFCEGGTGLNFPAPMLEFMFESTRALTHLILSGTIKRHRGVSFVIPHEGAANSVLADCVAAMMRMLPRVSALPSDEVFAELRRIYFDCAGAALPRLLPALMSLVGHSRLLYGSYWPHTPAPAVAALMNAIDQSDLLQPDQREAISRGTAQRLFPRLATLPRHTSP